MKRHVFILLLIMCIVTPCFAESMNIKQIVSDYKDLNYRFDVGISYSKFRDEYSDIYIKTRRYQDDNPGLYSNELNNINDVYNDISNLWRDIIDDRLIVVPNQTSRSLKKKYPGIESMVNKGIFGGWNPNSTILALNHIAKEKVSQLEINVNNKYNLNQPSYGFKYADGLIGGCIFITQIEPRSNAYEVGLRMGDKITKINDMPVTSVENFNAALVGPEGSKIKLHVKIDDENEKVIEIVKTIFPH